MPVAMAESATFASAVANGGKPNNSDHLRRLLMPTPTSMTLIASLQLLTSPLTPPHNVYLMTPSYLQNWLVWAYHQQVPEEEASRVQEAVRLAAIRHRLTPPALDMSYNDPGPIDCLALSVQGHPLLLRPDVAVIVSSTASPAASSPSAVSAGSKLLAPMPPSIRRVKSLPDEHEDAQSNEEKGKKVAEIRCCAVPEKFYETLRSVHGVLCDDGFSVSFQPFERGYNDALIHHHDLSHGASSKIPEAEKNGQNNRSNGAVSTVKPVEFRRKVVLQPVTLIAPEPKSLMEKLMQEEEKLKTPRFVPFVEVHPIKILYSIATEEQGTNAPNGNDSHDGFVLVSRDENVFNALQMLMKVAAPKKITSCVRLWSKRSYARVNSYELIHLDDLGGSTNAKEKDDTEGADDEERDEKEKMMVGEWVQRHSISPIPRQLEVIVETRKTAGSSWPRESVELENRIKVGDFVDAQDSAGKWYEAVVREVTDDSVTVHYCGWATKWDSTIRRRRSGTLDGPLGKTNPPAPLWSRADRWREHLAEGYAIEVRDSSSLALRPRWYKGEVKKVGGIDDRKRELSCGAELETFDIGGDGSDKKPLLILNRSQQVLVEVVEERTRKALSPSASKTIEEKNAQEPWLRWVDVFGEEICQMGTHLRNVSDLTGPATLVYDFDSRRAPVEIMKSANNMHGAGFVRESLRGIPPAPGSVGLHNLGNSCFLNSIVQCLNPIEPLSDYFLKDHYMPDLNKKNPLGSGGNVARAYASLQKKMWGGEYSILVPRLLKQTVANFAPQFDNAYQHDSHEFCQFLMDGLHEDLNRVKNKPYVEELEGFGMPDDKAAIESWRKHLLRHDSIIVDHCQGMHRSHLTCPVCGRESIKFDVFSSISLPLNADKLQPTLNLMDCLEKFMEGEQLDELNAWYCPNCRKHVCALKMIALWTVPDILILHLKRFTFDTCSQSGGVVRSKIDYKIEFPIENVDFSKYVLGPYDEDAPPVYKLFGVSEHCGKTANSGHYTATVRNSIDGKWYRCNDSHIGRTSGEASVTGGAYLLFYKRTNGLSKWGGMEKVMRDRGIDPYGGLEVDQEGFTKVKTKKKRKPKTG